MTSARLLISPVLLTAMLFAQSPLPPAPGAAVLDITPSGGRVSEPSIAINPNNPNQLVAVYQGGSAVQGSGGAAYSVDGGRTFTPADAAKPADWRVVGDVTTTFDNQGHAFWCYLAFDRLGTNSYWAHNAGRNGIFVRRSLDGGKTWAKDSVAVKAFPTGHEQNLQFEDEPRIFADNGGHSRLRRKSLRGLGRMADRQIRHALFQIYRSRPDVVARHADQHAPWIAAR